MYAVLCFVVVMTVHFISLFVRDNSRAREVNHREKKTKNLEVKRKKTRNIGLTNQLYGAEHYSRSH
jgi:hypothetical protein